MSLEHIYEGWFNFCSGTGLVKCQLRVHQRIPIFSKLEHELRSLAELEKSLDSLGTILFKKLKT
jgi:hypothetical protein